MRLIHQSKPEEVTESNWFFLLCREEEWLRHLLTDKEGYRIVPDQRAPETLSLIESSEFARYFEKIRKANPRIAEACKEGMRIGTPNIIFRLTNVDGVGLLKSDLEPSNHAITEAETEKIAQLLLASGHVKAWMVWALQSRGMGIPSWAGNPHGYVNAIGIIASFCWPAKQ